MHQKDGLVSWYRYDRTYTEVRSRCPPVDKTSCLVEHSTCIGYPSSKHSAGRQCGARGAGACCLFRACRARPRPLEPASHDCSSSTLHFGWLLVFNPNSPRRAKVGRRRQHTGNKTALLPLSPSDSVS